MKIEKELEHPILKVIFTNALTKGQYKIINNVVEYALDIPKEVVNHIQFKLDIATTSFKLNELKEEVKRLIDDYKIDYLGDSFTNIENKLANIIKQENETIQKRQAEDEQRTAEDEQRKAEDEQRKQ